MKYYSIIVHPKGSPEDEWIKYQQIYMRSFYAVEKGRLFMKSGVFDKLEVYQHDTEGEKKCILSETENKLNSQPVKGFKPITNSST